MDKVNKMAHHDDDGAPIGEDVSFGPTRIHDGTVVEDILEADPASIIPGYNPFDVIDLEKTLKDELEESDGDSVDHFARDVLDAESFVPPQPDVDHGEDKGQFLLPEIDDSFDVEPFKETEHDDRTVRVENGKSYLDGPVNKFTDDFQNKWSSWSEDILVNLKDLCMSTHINLSAAFGGVKGRVPTIESVKDLIVAIEKSGNKRSKDKYTTAWAISDRINEHGLCIESKFNNFKMMPIGLEMGKTSSRSDDSYWEGSFGYQFFGNGTHGLSKNSQKSVIRQYASIWNIGCIDLLKQNVVNDIKTRINRARFVRAMVDVNNITRFEGGVTTLPYDDMAAVLVSREDSTGVDTHEYQKDYAGLDPYDQEKYINRAFHITMFRHPVFERQSKRESNEIAFFATTNLPVFWLGPGLDFLFPIVRESNEKMQKVDFYAVQSEHFKELFSEDPQQKHCRTTSPNHGDKVDSVYLYKGECPKIKQLPKTYSELFPEKFYRYSSTIGDAIKIVKERGTYRFTLKDKTIVKQEIQHNPRSSPGPPTTPAEDHSSGEEPATPPSHDEDQSFSPQMFSHPPPSPPKQPVSPAPSHDEEHSSPQIYPQLPSPYEFHGSIPPGSPTQSLSPAPIHTSERDVNVLPLFLAACQ